MATGLYQYAADRRSTPRHRARTYRPRALLGLAAAVLSGALLCCSVEFATTASGQTRVGSREFQLRQPTPDGGGSIFVHDVNGDGLRDFLVTSSEHIGAYDNAGTNLWIRKGDIKLSDYYHHPSAIAGDMDGDGEQEVAYLTTANQLVILDGRTGGVEKTLPDLGAVTTVAIADLRGEGDRDAILQYSQTEIRAIRLDNGTTLWETNEYRGVEHSPLRQADLDGDGLDEVAGASIIDHDGRRMNAWDLGDVYRHMDSIVIADIVPGGPLEVALAEQRGARSHTDVVNPERIVFRSLNPWDWEDPDKLAVGDFDRTRTGLEIFNRSSGSDGTAPRGKQEPYRYEEAPWVLDSEGNLIGKYYLNDKKPSWWTGHGLEEICRIDWDGDSVDEIVGKERHKNGAAAIVDPITGEFREILRAKAVRAYAADILGDYREEVIIVDEAGLVRVFWNDEDNANPAKPRYWAQQHYRRQKQNWNYYSP